MRSFTRFASFLLISLIATIVLAGCAGSGDSDDFSKSPASAKSDPASDGEVAADASVNASLEVRLTGVGEKEHADVPTPSNMRCTKSIPAQCNATIECPVADEKDPFATSVEVCAWLAGDGAKLLTEEPAEDEVCTQIYGGPAKATVTGTIGDEKVDATLSRENGCAISRWDTVQPLWTGEIPEPPVSSETREPDVIDDPPEAFDR